MPTKPLLAGLLALSCVLCCPVHAQYSLTLESSPAVGAGGTVYRFFVNAENDTDKFSAVYGTDIDNLTLNTPAGIFNSPYNSSWNASGINPMFLSVFPDLADDSYATIGLSGPASSSGIAGAADPSLVEDGALTPTVSNYFGLGGTSLNVNTLLGASWYVLNTATNALPVDGRWFIMQVTTAGEISGQLNYQVFPLGVGADQVTTSVEFSGTGTFPNSPGSGCTDAAACNYDAEALEDDGSCEFESCVGCTDQAACNFNPEATVEANEECVFCNCDDLSQGYALVVSATPSANVAGSTVYRFSVRMENAGDQMSAVFGNYENPLDVLVPDGAFNSSLNAGWNASGLNPAFVSSFPEMADDTYATIGLEGPASTSGIEGAADPLLVEDSSQPITPFFASDGATQLLSNGLIGSSWFNTNDATNTYPNDDLEVLILQITTAGSVSGSINVQILPNGSSGEGSDLQKTFAFEGTGTFVEGGVVNACGCTDMLAPNYDPSADYDDGTCLDPVLGCTDPAACNFNPEATLDDGTCAVLDECGVCGGSGIPEGDCDCEGNQLDAIQVCGGTCEADDDEDGICDDVDDCVGAYDACGVCNGPGEIYECGCSGIPEGDCDCEGNQLDALDVCGGLCEADEDNDGICDDVDDCVGLPSECCTDYNQNELCDANEVVGCTFASAPNYDPLATMDNGTCIVTCAGDLSGDGLVQLTDLLDFLILYGQHCD